MLPAEPTKLYDSTAPIAEPLVETPTARDAEYKAAASLAITVTSPCAVIVEPLLICASIWLAIELIISEPAPLVALPPPPAAPIPISREFDLAVTLTEPAELVMVELLM